MSEKKCGRGVIFLAIPSWHTCNSIYLVCQKGDEPMSKKPLKVKMIPKGTVLVSRLQSVESVPVKEAIEEVFTSRPKMVRFPNALHTKLVVEAGERTARTGKRVSVNEVIVSILTSYFEPLDRKRG